MALVNMRELLKEAESKKIGYGAFSVGNMEMVRGAIMAAEELHSPIILQIAEVRLKHSPLELMGPMMISAAKNAKVDVAVHLDHGLSISTIKRALEIGFTSIMFDGSLETFSKNMELTKEIVSLARRYDAGVEAELGMVGGSEDGSSNHKIRYTNPQEAKEFYEQTQIDALAVAIGNAHGQYCSVPNLQFEVLDKIHQEVDGPLVLHGGSGISDVDFQECIRLGVRKVNIATASFQVLVKHAKGYFQEEINHNYFALNDAMVKGTYETVKHHIKVFQNL